jgi:hypothetical protein
MNEKVSQPPDILGRSNILADAPAVRSRPNPEQFDHAVARWRAVPPLIVPANGRRARRQIFSRWNKRRRLSAWWTYALIRFGQRKCRWVRDTEEVSMPFRSMAEGGALTSDDLNFLQQVYEAAAATVVSVDDDVMHDVVQSLILNYQMGERDREKLVDLAARDLHRAAG